MAGQPLKRACHRALDEHEEEIFERLASGAFVTELCREYLAEPYAEAGHGDPNTYHFYSWLDAAEGRRARFERVREAAADAVAEESVRILDEAREDGVSSTAEATLARSQSSSRQWWASKLNRSKYGEGRQGVDVNINVRELHLDALKKHGGREKLERSEREQLEGDRRGLPGELAEADYEVVGAESPAAEDEFQAVEEVEG